MTPYFENVLLLALWTSLLCGGLALADGIVEWIRRHHV
jgi:hypothetical protein